MSLRQVSCASILASFLMASLTSLSGCGGSSVDVTRPAEVTDEMKRQAEAADKFFTDESKTKTKKSSN